MMKKSWILLLVLAAFLVIPCSALAGHPIDGNWRFTSGSVELVDAGSGSFKGDIDLDSVDPSVFPMLMYQDEDGYVLDVTGVDVDAVDFNLNITEATGAFRETEEEVSWSFRYVDHLVKSPNAEEYNSDFIDHDDGYSLIHEKANVKFSSDYSTITIRREAEARASDASITHWSYIEEYVLARVGGGSSDPATPFVLGPNMDEAKREPFSLAQDALAEIHVDFGFGTVNFVELEGNVFITEEIARAIAAKEISITRVVPLPVFEAGVTANGRIAAVRIPAVPGANFLAREPKDIRLLKVISPEEGVFLRYITAAAGDDTDDGTFTLLESGTLNLAGTINPDYNYDLMVFIQDGGKYDLDKAANSKVVDPLAIIQETQSNGRGGCNAGLGVLALALMFSAVRITRRR